MVSFLWVTYPEKYGLIVMGDLPRKRKSGLILWVTYPGEGMASFLWVTYPGKKKIVRDNFRKKKTKQTPKKGKNIMLETL